MSLGSRPFLQGTSPETDPPKRLVTGGRNEWVVPLLCGHGTTRHLQLRPSPRPSPRGVRHTPHPLSYTWGVRTPDNHNPSHSRPPFKPPTRPKGAGLKDPDTRSSLGRPRASGGSRGGGNEGRHRRANPDWRGRCRRGVRKRGDRQNAWVSGGGRRPVTDRATVARDG